MLGLCNSKRLFTAILLYQFGNIKRFDKDGFMVSVLPGEVFVRYDEDGYRVEKD